MKEFYPLRLKLYGERKDFLLGMLTAEALKLSNQARFILAILEDPQLIMASKYVRSRLVRVALV